MSVPILKIRDKDGNVSSIPAIKGAPGKSAYEYAKEGGYTGTEEEFAKKLADEYSEDSDDTGYLSYVTPEMYGAKHDGTTDDAEAFTQALNTGLPVMLLGGEKAYTIKSPVEVNIDGAYLMGECVWNSDNQFSSVNVSGSGCFHINGEYFICRNAYFYTYNSTVESTFVLNGKDNLNVDADFYNCGFSSGTVAITCNGRGLKIDGCLFARIPSAVVLNYQGTTSGTGDVTTDKETGGRGFVITNNRYHSGVLFAVEVAENSNAVEMLYQGNLSDHYGAGFRINGSLRNSVISSNVFANCSKAVFNVGSTGVFENITISNNEFNSKQTNGLDYCEQFFVASAGAITNNITFEGNNFNGTKYRCIGFLNECASGIIIDSNRFENINMVGDNITYGAICLPPTSENIVIVNNMFGHLAASVAGCCVRCTSTPILLNKFVIQNNLKIHDKDYLCHSQLISSVTDSQIQEQHTNPNLLINGDFSVNQRGQSSYTNQSSKTYTVDRWCLLGNSKSQTLTVNDDKSITLSIDTSKETTGSIRQFLERLDNGTYTISAKVNGVVYSHVFEYRGAYVDYQVVDGLFLGFSVGAVVLAWNGTKINNMKVEWMKVEQGYNATPFIPRMYAEELALCQRQYFKAKATGWTYVANGCFGTDKNFFCTFALPCEMRVKPTVTYSNVYVDRLDTTPVMTTITSLEALSVFGANVILVAKAVSSLEDLTSYNGMLVFENAESYIAFDSEIY